MNQDTNITDLDSGIERTARKPGENVYRLSVCPNLTLTGESKTSDHETIFPDVMSLDQSLLRYLKPEIEDPGIHSSHHYRQLLDEVNHVSTLRLKESGQETLGKCAQLLAEDKQLRDLMTVKCNSAGSV